MVQVVEHCLASEKPLISNPSTTKNKQKDNLGPGVVVHA
jgi:hypothetical protein